MIDTIKNKSIAMLKSMAKKRSANKINKRTKARTAPGFSLSASQHKDIDEVWGCTGAKHIAHAFYTEKTGVFSPLYVPCSMLIYYIDQHYNDWPRGKFLDNKCYYTRMFPEARMPKTVAFRLNSFWYDGDEHIITLDRAFELVSSVKECFIKKAADSFGGKGVYYYCPSDGKDFFKVIDQISGDIVIQEGVAQSKEMSRLNASSVNTVRLISMLRKDGSVKIYSTIVRMGVGGAKVDNASQGGITCGVQDDGRLKSVAYTNKGVKFLEHPTTKIHFENVVIPDYQGVVELVKKLHTHVPHFRLVSWDIAIDENDKPVLIEANLCDGGIDIHQLNNGPLFKEDTQAIIEEVFKK